MGPKQPILWRRTFSTFSIVSCCLQWPYRLCQDGCGKRPNADVDDCTGETPLWAAIQTGHTEICMLLMEAGADPFKPANDGILRCAATNGHTDIVKMITEKIPNADRDGCSGMTPLMAAAREGHAEICKLLIEAGADPFKKLVYEDTVAEDTVLFYAAREGLTDIANIIIEKSPKMGLDDLYEGKTPLMAAAENGHAAICKLLVQAGADLNKKSVHDYYNPYTALMLAAKNEYSKDGCAEVCDILITAGADTNITHEPERETYGQRWPGYGLTARDLATYENVSREIETDNAAVVAVFEKHGVSPQPLQLAHILNTHGLAQDNLDKEVDEDGNTALHYATKIPSEPACKILIEAGADVNKKNQNGLTPFSGAYNKNWNYDSSSPKYYVDGNICQMLIEAGADVDKEEIYKFYSNHYHLKPPSVVFEKYPEFLKDSQMNREYSED